MNHQSTSPRAAAAPSAPGADPGAPAWYRNDRIFQISIVAWLAVVAPYAVYLFGGDLTIEYRNTATFALLSAVQAFAALADVRRQRSHAERRLRAFVGISFFIWAVIESIQYFDLSNGLGLGAVVALEDSLYVVFYILFGFAALEDRRVGEASEARRLHLLRRAETALFVFGLFVYFIVLPSRLDPRSVGSSLPSSFLYVALDGFILALFSRRLFRAEGPRDTARWRLFTLGAALFLLTDTLYFFSLAGQIDLESRPLADVLWYVPHLFVLVAVRMSTGSERISGDIVLDERELPSAPFAPSFLYAALVPATHLLAEATGVTSAEAGDAQRTCALVLTILLGSIATLHQRRIARVHEALRREVFDARRRLAASQRLEAIGRLSAGVAHDFNNLLTVVLGRAELLLGRTEAPGARRDLETIVRAAGRAAELTQELLAVGQRGRGVRSRVEVGELIAASLAELSGICGEGIELLVEREPQALFVDIDPAHLERVLRNLASNSRDAMPNGGRLTISTAVRHLANRQLVRDEELPAGSYASVVFRDSGAGMDEETMQRLFEPFFSTKALGRGTGLGLATAYGLVRQNGGQIVVESRPGQGARFELLLPIAEISRPGVEGSG